MALKAGRPTGRTQDHVDQPKSQLMHGGEEKRLNVRMLKREYRQLQRYAFEREMSISDVVRIALREYMSR